MLTSVKKAVDWHRLGPEREAPLVISVYAEQLSGM